MAEREAAALVIQTAVTNHTLRALERAEKEHKAVTLEMKGWNGWTTAEQKKSLIKQWCSQMTPAIPESEYQLSTEDHRGKESKVMHLRFSWPRQQIIFMKTVQDWGSAAKDQNGGVLTFNPSPPHRKSSDKSLFG